MPVLRAARAGMFVVGALALSTVRIDASAFALSDITVLNLTITSSVGASVLFDDFGTIAFAQAQNSLGDLEQQFDAQTDATSTANAAVTWASGQGIADEAEWTAASSANIAAPAGGTATSVGQALWTRLIGFNGAGTDPIEVTFSVDLLGSLSLMTDALGESAQSDVTFNLLLDGDSVLFYHLPQSIGASSAVDVPFSLTLTNTITLDPTVDYLLFLRVDSESFVMTQAVPEPATLLLFGIGLFAVGHLRRRPRDPNARRVVPAKAGAHVHESHVRKSLSSAG